MQAQTQFASVSAKFQSLLEYTNFLNLERNTENFLEIVSLLMKRPMLKIGEPGTNKSGSSKVIFGCFTDAKVFRVGLTANSTADQVFGGLIVGEYLKGIQAYNTDQGAAKYHFVIFDEIFKVENADLLNKFLFFFDEVSEIFQAGKMEKTMFQGGILTSNELPLPGSHDALMNRISIKAFVNRLQLGSNRKLMLKGKHNTTNLPMPQLRMADLFQAREKALKVTISESILNLLICDEEYDKICQMASVQGMGMPPLDQSRALVDKLCVQGVKVSDRQIVQLMGEGVETPSFLQSVAWLSGSNEVTEDHLMYLLNALWRNEQEIPKIKEVLKTLDTATQYAEQVTKMRELFINFKNQKDDTENDKKKKRACGLSMMYHVYELIKKLDANASSPKILKLLAEMSSIRDQSEVMIESLGKQIN